MIDNLHKQIVAYCRVCSQLLWSITEKSKAPGNKVEIITFNDMLFYYHNIYRNVTIVIENEIGSGSDINRK